LDPPEFGKAIIQVIYQVDRILQIKRKSFRLGKFEFFDNIDH